MWYVGARIYVIKKAGLIEFLKITYLGLENLLLLVGINKSSFPRNILILNSFLWSLQKLTCISCHQREWRNALVGGIFNNLTGSLLSPCLLLYPKPSRDPELTCLSLSKPAEHWLMEEMEGLLMNGWFLHTGCCTKALSGSETPPTLFKPTYLSHG